MKPVTYYFLLFAVVFSSCAKTEQFNETSLAATVVDPTTGHLGEKAFVSLVEIETPSRPFTPLNRVVVEEFEVNYGEEFTYSFNAKRGDRFEYRLEYVYPNFYFGGYGSSNMFYYPEETEVKVEKGTNGEYLLSIVPLAGLDFRVKNKASNASANDSIYAELFDGSYKLYEIHIGKGSSPTLSTNVPHGEYELSYSYFQDGVLIVSESSDVSLRHATDTTIVVSIE